MILEHLKKKNSCPLGGASVLFTFLITGNESVSSRIILELFLAFSESLGPWLSMFKKFAITIFFSPVMNDYVIF